jgi:hypothetical protein
VTQREPLWAKEPLRSITHLDGEDLTIPEHGHHRAVLTSVLDGADLEAVSMPHPSLAPLTLAGGITLLCVSVVASSAILAVLAVIVMIAAFIRWQSTTS